MVSDLEQGIFITLLSAFGIGYGEKCLILGMAAVLGYLIKGK